MIEERILHNSDKIVLGARQMHDGSWRSLLIVTYKDEGRRPYIGENDQSFSSEEAAREWSEKYVVPLLRLIGKQIGPDANRPKGLHCTRYDWVDDEKVYCGQPALYHLALAPVAEDEFCCEQHHEELLKVCPPEVQQHLRRIN